VEQVVFFVGILTISFVLGIYAGGKRAMKIYGYQCPKLFSGNKTDKKVDLPV